MTLRLGISTCPNDTFAFHALLAGAVDDRGLDLSIELGDVQELNERLAAGELDAAKVSFHAALRASERWIVLPVGSALGFGVGPLLVAAARHDPGRPTPRVLCPGEDTTATLLYRLFHPGEGRVEQVVFSAILPALARGEADLGVCIHEGRFTYEELGLARVEDLGETWERATGAPLPLGGIAVRREVGEERARRLADAIGASLDHAHAHRAETLPTLRRHAQELADDVLWAHVDLYVNAWTRELGSEGRRALAELHRRAREAGVVAPDAPPLVVLDAVPGCSGTQAVPETPRRLFHVAPRGAWDPATGESWSPPSLATEGFVHLSFADQLAGTLAAHFAEAPPQRLYEVCPRAVADALRLEPSRGGALFPHVYRPLRPADVLGAWALERRDGAWSLPRLGERAADDEPPAGAA